MDSEKCKQERLEAAQKRFEIFEEFRKAGTFDATSVDLKNAKELIRMMDTGEKLIVFFVEMTKENIVG